MNIVNLLELCDNIINNKYINVHIFLNYVNNKNIINADNKIYHQIIKNAVLKLSENNSSCDFIKIYNLYENDNEGYGKIIFNQYKLDNNIFSNTRYYLSEYFLKTDDKLLLENILNKQDVFLNLYLLKMILQKIYYIKKDDDNLLNTYIKFFNNLDENYTLIYFYSLVNDNIQNINYIKYINILYDKLKDNLSYEENIDIFKKIIIGKYYDILKNIILKIKNNFKINLVVLLELINIFTNDQKKVDILLKYFEIEITDELIILLIKNKYSVNTDIKINNNILKECSTYNYYPYKIDFIPDNTIMEMESKKINNLNRFKSFHLLGSNITLNHLKNACRVKYNEEMIKYIIDSGIIPDEDCLIIFKVIYNNTIIDNFLNNYLSNEPLNKNNNKLEIIDEKNLFFIEKNDMTKYKYTDNVDKKNIILIQK